MNRLTPWYPILKALQASPGRATDGRQCCQAVSEWTPVVDISEDANEYLIKAELPEVKREDVKLTVEGGVLALSGERRFEKEETGRKYHRVERAYGSYHRSFNLPEDADPDKVTADFKDGLLQIHLGKKEVVKPRQIEVTGE